MPAPDAAAYLPESLRYVHCPSIERNGAGRNRKAADIVI